jgi:lipopolysaccharide transport system permease protein
MIPPRWQLAAGFNPMLGILEGFRWTLIGSASPMLGSWIALSWLVTLGFLVTGILMFLWGEETLADVI